MAGPAAPPVEAPRPTAEAPKKVKPKEPAIPREEAQEMIDVIDEAVEVSEAGDGQKQAGDDSETTEGKANDPEGAGEDKEQEKDRRTEVAREGLGEILVLSGSRIAGRDRAERVKGRSARAEKKREKRKEKIFAKGNEDEDMIRQRAAAQIEKGTTPQEICDGIDVLDALDARRLRELQERVGYIEKNIHKEPSKSQPTLKGEYEEITAEIGQRQELMKNRSEVRAGHEKNSGEKIPNKIDNTVHNIIVEVRGKMNERDAYQPPEGWQNDPLLVVEDLANKAGEQPVIMEAVTESILSRVGHENEKMVKDLLKPDKWRKRGKSLFMILLIAVAGGLGLQAKNASKSVKQQGQGQMG